MSLRKVPPSRRFFLARLRPFFRPTFLLSTFFIGLLGVSIWQYWQDPNSLSPTVSSPSGDGTQPQVRSKNESIAPEESQERAAVNADIDNSQLLKEELQGFSNNPQTVPATKGKNKNKESETQDTAYSRYFNGKKDGKQSELTNTKGNSSIPSAREILNGSSGNTGTNTNPNVNANINTNNPNTGISNNVGGTNLNTNNNGMTTQPGTTISNQRTYTPTLNGGTNTGTGVGQIGNVGNNVRTYNGGGYNTNFNNNPYSGQTSTFNNSQTGVNGYNSPTTNYGNSVPTVGNTTVNNGGYYNNTGNIGNTGYNGNTGTNTGYNTNLNNNNRGFGNNYNSTPVQSNYSTNYNNTYNSGYQNNRTQNVGGNNQSGFVNPQTQIRGYNQPNVYYPQTR